MICRSACVYIKLDCAVHVFVSRYVRVCVIVHVHLFINLILVDLVFCGATKDHKIQQKESQKEGRKEIPMRNTTRGERERKRQRPREEREESPMKNTNREEERDI